MTGARENRLVQDALPILREEAQRLWRRLGRRIELDELQALGHEALLEVARRYDADRGPFRPFAAVRLRWAMLDGIRRTTHGRVAAARALAMGATEQLGEIELTPQEQSESNDEAGPDPAPQDRLRALLRRHAGALAVALVAARGEASGIADPQENPEQAMVRASLSQQLHAAVRELPQAQRALVEQHYFEGEPFERIATDLGISKSWASRLHAQAMDALAARLRPLESDPGGGAA